MKDFNQVRRGVVDKGIGFRAGGWGFEPWWGMSKTNYLKKESKSLGKLGINKEGKKHTEC